MNPALEIRNLSRFYGTIPALNNFSLNFGKGEVVGIAGANGSGKTTLLNILSGDAGGKPPASPEKYCLTVNRTSPPIHHTRSAPESGWYTRKRH